MKTFGVLTAVTGGLIAVCGVVILAFFGFHGVWDTDSHAVASTTPALVSSAGKVRGVSEGTEFLGQPTVRIDIDDDQFVGVGRAKDVERYLAGVPHDEVTDIESDPFRFETKRVNGTHAAVPPAQESFWIAQDSKSLRWKVKDGDYRIVIMSADGRSALITTGTFGVQIPVMPTIGTGLTLFGLLLFGAGCAMRISRPQKLAYA